MRWWPGLGKAPQETLGKADTGGGEGDWEMLPTVTSTTAADPAVSSAQLSSGLRAAETGRLHTQVPQMMRKKMRGSERMLLS